MYGGQGYVFLKPVQIHQRIGIQPGRNLILEFTLYVKLKIKAFSIISFYLPPSLLIL
jgi:hypothetical protein